MVKNQQHDAVEIPPPCPAKPEFTPTEPDPESTPANPEAPPQAVLEPELAPQKPRRDIRIPKPPHFRFSSDAADRGQRPDKFFGWWANLEKPIQEALYCYVYRDWPVVRTMILNRGKLEPSSQIEKLQGNDVITDTDEMLHRYGSGDYRLRLNSCDPSKTITQCKIRVRDREHPPVIPDLSTLVMDDPLNKSYIEDLRLKGVRLPGERASQEEEDDMASVKTVEVLTDRLGEMADRVVAVSERAADARAAAAEAQATKDEREKEKKEQTTDPASKAGLEGIGMMVKAGELCNTMIQNAATQAQTLQGRMSDPIELMAKTVALLKDLKGSEPAPTGGMVSDVLLKRIETLETALTAAQEARIKLIEGLLTKSTSGEQSSALAGAGGKPSLAAQVKELVEAFDALQELRGGEENPVRAATGGKYGWIPGAIQGALSLAGMISNIVYNAKAGGTPVPPSAPPVVQPQLAAAMEGAAPPGAMPGAPPMDPVRGMLMQLEKPLLSALEQEKTGDEFADTLIGWVGRIPYEQLKSLGKDQIMQMLQTYPPIWAVVMQVPQRFEQFLQEFLDHDAIVEREAQEGLDPEVIKPKRVKPVVS